MIPIDWTQAARSDLRAIHAYIARDSRVYAKRFIDRIKASAQRLSEFPYSGAVVPDWEREDVREILVGNYRVIYRLHKDRVEILGVIHGARQLPDLV